MKNKDGLTKYMVAIGLQVVILLALIGMKALVFVSGTEILLEIEPVDPRSPLRGDYITFQYEELSTLESYVSGVADVERGETVYVVLRKNGTYWKADSVEKVPPSNGELFIKGKVVMAIDSVDSSNKRPRMSGGKVRIEYGIEEYFIPEGSGRNMSFVNKETGAKVMVDGMGRAVLKQVLVEGQPWP